VCYALGVTARVIFVYAFGRKSLNILFKYLSKFTDRVLSFYAQAIFSKAHFNFIVLSAYLGARVVQIK